MYTSKRFRFLDFLNFQDITNLILYRLNLRLRLLGEAIFSCITSDNWDSLSQCDVLLVCHDNDRGYTYQNQAYSQLLDSLGDLLKQNGLITQSVAAHFSRLTKCRSYGQPVAINRASLSIAIQAEIVKFIKGQEKSEKWKKEQRKNLWRKILISSRPQVVISIQPEASLCQACHSQSVPLYDMQHGAISDEQKWYGKNHRENTDVYDLPNGFLCWDNMSAITLDKWASKKGISIQILGHPWFQRFLTNNSKDSLVQESLKQQPRLINDNPTILVSLQWGMAIHSSKYVPNGVMPSCLEQTILKTSTKYNWLLRLHPTQIRGSESSMVQNYLTRTFGDSPMVEWKQCSDVPLPIVLEWADVHITWHSNTTTEAAWMGLHTGLLNPEIHPGGKSNTYYNYERSIGLAETISLDPITIEAWIKSTLIKGKRKPALFESSDTLKNFIKQIISHS